MTSRTLTVLALVAVVATSSIVFGVLRGQARPEDGRPKPAPAAPGRPQPAAAPAKPQAGAAQGPLRYLALGGGAFPESTEVSLEQDLALALNVLPGPGAVLFAGGQGSRVVRVEEPAMRGDALLVELGQLFQPRPGRHSRYKVSELPAKEASKKQLERALHEALGGGGSALTLYVAAHGEQGESERDNRVVLWGGDALTVAELAQLHARHARPLRLVMASCYSGGFAELAFQDAEAERGPSRVARCGLFAGTWDRQTSGCDPNPDRALQESYSLHLWHALQGQDRAGQSLPLAELDFDGDGRIGLLEAHTRARVASRSIDVPTTTSERYLRQVEQAAGAEPGARGQTAQQAPAAADTTGLVEEHALLDRLGPALGLRDAAAVEARLDGLGDRLDALAARLDEAEAALDAAYGTLAARLLARWPVLDDPYHPEFAGLLAAERAPIGAALQQWPEAETYRQAQQAVDTLDGSYWELQIDEARVMRLARAHETLRLAAQLQARGGPALRAYQALLQCERAPLP